MFENVQPKDTNDAVSAVDTVLSSGEKQSGIDGQSDEIEKTKSKATFRDYMLVHPFVTG